MVVRVLAFLLIVAVSATVAVAPTAAEIVSLGEFKDWRAYKTTQGGKRLCYMVSKPRKAEGKYTRRGEIYAFVTHRPAAKRFNEVSIDAGYTYKEGSEIKVRIADKSFTLHPHERSAWAGNDDAIIAAMKAGSEMVVRGVSSRGTKTKDTYSLLGFTAAHNAISKACGLH